MDQHSCSELLSYNELSIHFKLQLNRQKSIETIYLFEMSQAAVMSP